MLESTEKGSVRNSIRNCLTVFQNDPLLSGAIAKNLLTERVDIVKPIGYHRIGTAITDTDMNYLLLYLEETYGLTSEKQSDQIRIDLVHSPEFTPQEAGDQLAVHRRVETRKMEKMALHPLLGKHAAHKFHLGRFPGAVQSFQYYQHILAI